MLYAVFVTFNSMRQIYCCSTLLWTPLKPMSICIK